jgi:hypothetical protein
MFTSFILSTFLGGVSARWFWESEPITTQELLPVSGIQLPISFTSLISIMACWVLPTAFWFITTQHSTSGAGASTSAKTATGEAVPKDIERRKVALAADEAPKKQRDRMLQAVIAAYVLLPLLWAVQTQTNPTVSEQFSDWMLKSWTQLTDNRVTLHFQLAVAALSIERLCYTWVHTFSESFVRFSKTSMGKRMGDTPLDVVFSIFCINKCIQIGTFVLWYHYVIAWHSPFSIGFTFANVTRFQWVCFMHGIVLGQGLNSAIYRAIGKAGVYYGYRLGIEVPWVTGFPFNVGFPHPQYLGTCVTVIGVNVMVATPTHLAAGWLNLTMVQVLYYIYMGLVEDYL